jgi:hypothetical protein
MKICKKYEHQVAEFQALISSGATEIDDKTVQLGDDKIYLCTPCFADADRLFNIEFDRYDILIPSEEIDQFDQKWINELTHNY